VPARIFDAKKQVTCRSRFSFIVFSSTARGNDGHGHGGEIDAPRQSRRRVHAHRCRAVDLPDCSDPARDGGGVAMTGFRPCQLIKINSIIVKY